MAVLVDNLSPRLLALLWSAVLLSRGAADCPKPPEKDHIVLTNESLLKNSFPKDTEVTFVCTNGYEILNGSNSITCTGTEWTEPELTCKKKDCGYPQKLPNMILNVNDGTLLGASVEVSCELGYRLIGSFFKRCFSNGWIGRAKCDLVVCNVPSEVIGGNHTWTSAKKPHYRDIIQYSCDPGFTLNGTSHVICQGRGVYNATPPTCEAIVCDLPSEINDGRHLWTSADQPRYKDVIHYSCNTGFTLHGSSQLICQSPGAYNSAPPTCKEDKSTIPSLNIISTPLPSIQGGRHTLAATEDNLMNTEASSSPPPSLVAATVPATPGTHGANTVMTTHKHAISTKSRTPAVTTPEHLKGNVMELDNIKETDRDTKDAVSLRRNIVVASVLSTILVVLTVMLIFYAYRYRWRRGSYDTQEDLKPGLLQFQSL